MTSGLQMSVDTYVNDITTRPSGDYVYTNVHPVLPLNANITNASHNNNNHVEFTQFLLKKELLLSRLFRYNDKQEDYRMWKSGSKSSFRTKCLTGGGVGHVS